MAKRDYYNVLGVSRDATADQIRSSYRKLARKYHPDVNRDDPKAEDKFKEVQEAYDVLSDKQKRAAYDQFGFAGPGQAGGPGAAGWQAGPGGSYRRTWATGGGMPGVEGFEFGDLGDLFEMFGGAAAAGQRGARGGAGRGRARRGGPTRGADIEHEEQISFEESAHGTRREVVLRSPAGEQKLSVKIPAGINDGARIRLAGKGQPGPGGESGDLLITVRVQPHAYFKRQGLDVLVELPLTAGEAALGTKVRVPTLTGKVELTVPPGTSSGARLRLRGLGVKNERAGEQGDQYVIARIVLPRTLDEESRRLIGEFDARNPMNPRKDLGW